MSGTLYAMRAADGEPIYIGASMHAVRLGQHHNKPWWDDVAYVEVEHFDTREEAHAAEQEILEIERTRFNRRRNERIVSEDELAKRRESRARKNAEFWERWEAEKPQRELEQKKRTMYPVPDLHCAHCNWQGGWVKKGMRVAEAPCPVCGLTELAGTPLGAAA